MQRSALPDKIWLWRVIVHFCNVNYPSYNNNNNSSSSVNMKESCRIIHDVYIFGHIFFITNINVNFDRYICNLLKAWQQRAAQSSFYSVAACFYGTVFCVYTWFRFPRARLNLPLTFCVNTNLMRLDVRRWLVRTVKVVVVVVVEAVAVIVVMAVVAYGTARSYLTNHFVIQKTRHIWLWPIWNYENVYFDWHEIEYIVVL